MIEREPYSAGNEKELRWARIEEINKLLIKIDEEIENKKNIITGQEAFLSGELFIGDIGEKEQESVDEDAEYSIGMIERAKGTIQELESQKVQLVKEKEELEKDYDES